MRNFGFIFLLLICVCQCHSLLVDASNNFKDDKLNNQAKEVDLVSSLRLLFLNDEKRRILSEINYGDILEDSHKELFKSDLTAFINVMATVSNKLAAVGFLKRFQSVMSMNCSAEKHDRLLQLTDSFQDILHRTKLNQCTTEFCNTHLYQLLYMIQRWSLVMKSIKRDHTVSPYCWSTLLWNISTIDRFPPNATHNSTINKVACKKLYMYYSETLLKRIPDAKIGVFSVYDMDLSAPLLHPKEHKISFSGQGRQWCPAKDIIECTQDYFECLSSKISSIPNGLMQTCYRETFGKVLDHFTIQLERWPQGTWLRKHRIKAVYKEFLDNLKPKKTFMEVLGDLYDDSMYYAYMYVLKRSQ